MKIIGLMLTWNNLEFFRCAVKQALEFCDELILVEGANSIKYPKCSNDGTAEFIQTIKAHPKLRIMDFTRGKRYDYLQRDIRREYPKQSRYYKPGNWVFQWDDDLLFMNDDLRKLRKMMQCCKKDSLNFMCRWFSYNFRFNVFTRMGPVCYRITDGLTLRGVLVAYYKDGRSYSVSYPNSIVAFHYSFVKKMDRLRARLALSAEKGTPGAMDKLNLWESIKWNKDKDIFNDDDIKKMMGKGELNIYEGAHPEALDSHPWRYIDDVRRLG